MKSNNYLFITIIGGLLSITATTHAQLAFAPQIDSLVTASYLTVDTLANNSTINQDDQSAIINNNGQSQNPDSAMNNDNMDDSDTLPNDGTSGDDDSSSPTYDSQNNDIPDNTNTGD
jgi:hypothetical protein